MPVYTAEDPLSCVARGAGKMVENFDNRVYRRILTQAQNTRRMKRA
jgi:rod shape-determining protein MreB